MQKRNDEELAPAGCAGVSFLVHPGNYCKIRHALHGMLEETRYLDIGENFVRLHIQKRGGGQY